jgi:hypothetical protein
MAETIVKATAAGTTDGRPGTTALAGPAPSAVIMGT